MKRLLMTLAVIAGSAIFSADAQAVHLVSGSQGLADLGIIHGNTNNLAKDTVFTNLQFITTNAQSGDYDTYVPNFPAATAFLSPPAATLNVASPASFTFGSAAFGTFTGATLVDSGYDPTTKSRSILITGTFTPGSLFGGAVGTNSAQVSLSFTQNGGPKKPYSVSGTLSSVAPSVPEPATLIMLATCAPVGLVMLRRRLRSIQE